jgi:hypothetical protein
LRIAVGVLSLSLLVASCSGIPRQTRDNERLERYQQYSGPPIDGFSYLGHYDGWNSLDEYHLVVWTGINTAYLITVLPPCNDLRFAERIGLTKTGSRVTRLDSVLVRHWRCPISEIRQVDYLRMRQDMRKEREDATAQSPHP